MKRENIQVESEYRSGGARALLLLPDAGRPRRLLTLLHGAGEGPEEQTESFDFTPWVDSGLAVLLPELDNSFCLDWGAGRDVRAALLRELLPAVQTRLALPSRPDNVVGGISMGGFAALSLALCEPERFCAAFSLSGALDLRRSAQILRICGLYAPEGLAHLEWSWDTLLTECANRPALYLSWGDRDLFREDNRAFTQRAQALGYAVEAAETPGLHNWDYWSQTLGPALDWASMA